jgi:hypothetical protein
MSGIETTDALALESLGDRLADTPRFVERRHGLPQVTPTFGYASFCATGGVQPKNCMRRVEGGVTKAFSGASTGLAKSALWRDRSTSPLVRALDVLEPDMIKPVSEALLQHPEYPLAAAARSRQNCRPDTSQQPVRHRSSIVAVVLITSKHPKLEKSFALYPPVSSIRPHPKAQSRKSRILPSADSSCALRDQRSLALRQQPIDDMNLKIRQRGEGNAGFGPCVGQQSD